MIYRLDLESQGIEEWLDVPDAGADIHDDTENFIPDLLAMPHAGKTSLGDIDLTETGDQLFVVNPLLAQDPSL